MEEWEGCVAAQGVWCVSCRQVLADSWLELSHKTPEPLSAPNGSQPAGTPGSAGAVKDPPLVQDWEGAQGCAVPGDLFLLYS